MTKVQTQIIPANEVQTIKGKSSVIIARAEALVVDSAEDENRSYDILGNIKDRLKEIEVRRTSITKPLNESLKETNKLFKTLSSPLKKADRIIRGKILDFHRIQEEKAAKEQERREKIQASHEERGHETHELAEVVPEVSQETVTTKRWTFELIAFKKIPIDYLMLDVVGIREAIRNGAREIAGLRIYQEEGLRV
jgi:hypothetical protein